MDIEEFRKAGYRAVDRICDYYASLSERPVLAQVKPGYLTSALPHEAPQKGESMDVIANDFQTLILPGITHWQHPSFFAYFPSNATFPGMLADIYASSVTNPGFNWMCSPACTELESVVMDWAANLLGLSSSFHVASGVGGGAIQSSASDSALVAVIAARARFLIAHPDVPAEKLVIYLSTQTHSLGTKTAAILNIPFRALPVMPEDAFSLRGDRLRDAYEEDRNAGKWPFVLIATVGSTSSGAVDALEELGPITKDFPDFWLHVDAAWAGVSFSCPEYREQGRLKEINAFADSCCVNFHKWGLVNFDASTLWLRDRRHLTEALDVSPYYLRNKHSDEGTLQFRDNFSSDFPSRLQFFYYILELIGTVIDYRHWQVALGRRFRSIKLWFVLRSYGVEGFQNHIRKCVRLGTLFHDLLSTSSIFEVVTPRSLALTVFRLIIPDAGADASSPPPASLARPIDLQTLNELNMELHHRLTEGSGPGGEDDKLFLTRTDLNGKVCIRLVVGAERTQEEHVQRAFDILCKVGKVLLNDVTPIREP
ncbi:hypothetical protein BS47DRAFT_1487046 [Hydnum rufescens UP504]|uniref:Tyrosine decarboxylase n=1 Tax=Hydnum rufescens UP504 TaxID=1448309 RepID=A0A9P6DU20_9AGAM|nr:hypothetical protein BS47DRAFT_1487046 [Hydnum rufescens UP504]